MRLPLVGPLTAQEAVNSLDKFWVPAPMIGYSYDGFDQSANFDGLTQLNVPARPIDRYQLTLSQSELSRLRLSLPTTIAPRAGPPAADLIPIPKSAIFFAGAHGAFNGRFYV